MGIYIGFKANKNPEIIESETKPTKKTHPRFDFIYGPYDSREKAQNYINALGSLACGDG